MIHRVLEVVEREAVAAGRDHGTIERAIAVLAAEFDPADFNGPPWADSWRSHAERILAHLYMFWPGRGPAVGFETAVTYELNGVPWSGRVDRAERRAMGCTSSTTRPEPAC